MSNEEKLSSRKWSKEHCSLDKTVSLPCWVKASSDDGSALMESRRVKIEFDEKHCELSLYKTGQIIDVQVIPTSIKLSSEKYDLAYIFKVNKKEQNEEDWINTIYLRVLKFKEPTSEEIKPILSRTDWVTGSRFSLKGCAVVLSIGFLLFSMWFCSQFKEGVGG